MSEYLRRVRLGHEVVITHREIPIARVIPYRPKDEELIVRPPTRPLKDLRLKELRRLPGVKAKKLKPGDRCGYGGDVALPLIHAWLSAVLFFR